MSHAFGSIVLLLSISLPSGLMQDALPDWTADVSVVRQLGEPFVDARIKIRPPPGLQEADRDDPVELARRGVFNYGWTPDGGFPNVTNFSVVLTPFAQHSSSALDKTVNGMKNSVRKNLEQVEFGAVEHGRFRGVEARRGNYTAVISGQTVTAIYLIGIDDQGTYAITTMLPIADATEDRMSQLRASLLTFDRVD